MLIVGQAPEFKFMLKILILQDSISFLALGLNPKTSIVELYGLHQEIVDVSIKKYICLDILLNLFINLMCVYLIFFINIEKILNFSIFIIPEGIK
jgi:hypothetical protein